MSEGKKEKASDKKEEEEKKEEKKSDPFHIPLRIVPNDSEEIAKEMQELFDEDKVKHRQGGSEPEAD